MKFVLCFLSDYTEVHHICHREHYILQIKFNTFRYHKCPYMARTQEDMTKKCEYLRPFQLNEHFFSAVDQSENLLGTNSRM